VTMEKSN